MGLPSVRAVHPIRSESSHKALNGNSREGSLGSQLNAPLESRSSLPLLPPGSGADLTTNSFQRETGWEGGTSSSLMPRIATKVENLYVLQNTAPTANEGQGLGPLLPTF